MKLLLALVCLACVALVNGHVIAVYNGMNIPIRSGSTPTSDGAATVGGPCGDVATFGANGITEIQSGAIINMQLKYQQAHPNGNLPNWFAVAMQCADSMTDLNSATNLRLFSNTNGARSANWDKSSVGIEPIVVDAQNLMNMPFVFPFTTPSGDTIKSGQYCTVAILDERNWGSCLDLKVKTAAGPIVAGVMTPVIGVGAAAAIFFGRGPITARLLPKAEGADPSGRAVRNGITAFVTMVLAIVACAAPLWSTGTNYKAGPWSFCPTTGDCYSASMGNTAVITAVRVFIITCVLAAVFAVAMPVLSHFGVLYPTIAAKAQTGLFLYMAVSSFISVMLWACILLVSSSLGASLILAMIVCVLSLYGTVKAWQWLKATEVAATAAMVTSGPLGISTASVPVVPTAYPMQTTTTTTGGGAYVAASVTSPKSFTTPPPPPPAHVAAAAAPQKWGSWEELWDAENGAYYFFNHSNGESAWEAPAGWPHQPRV